MAKKSRSAERLKALIKTQQINELLEKSTIQSEALQNVGDDRPAYESHVLSLLEEKPHKERPEGKKVRKSKK
jgi:hypothetical protein